MIFELGTEYSSREDAEHHAALLALHHLNAKLPHERKLPDPYREAWMKMAKMQLHGLEEGADKPPAIRSNFFVTQTERSIEQAKVQKVRNDKERKREANVRALPSVHMSTAHRTRIAATLEQRGGAGAPPEVPPVCCSCVVSGVCCM